MLGGQSTHLPLKVNAGGVIPVIFASSLLAFPATLMNVEFVRNSPVMTRNAVGHQRRVAVVLPAVHGSDHLFLLLLRFHHF